MRVFYCARTVFVLYSINISQVYYIKSINKTNFKALFYPDFSPKCTHEKSQSNPRHACAVNVCVSTQIKILYKAFSDLPPFRSF
nr:MAG TPA: hypothetical protein [Caudoviricetes sp.]